MSILPRPTAFARPSRLLAAGATVLLLTACAGGDEAEESPSPTTGVATETGTDVATGTEATADTEDASQDTEFVENAINAGYALNTVGDYPVVTMFTDYECPACQSAHPLVEEAAESLDGEVTVVVKNFPLPMHDNAVPAARAVEAAGMQGQAVEFANHLYENADDWSDLSGSELDDYFLTVAEQVAVDTEQFTGDYSSEAVASIVDQHAAQAETLDLQGTPSFVVADQDIDLSDVSTVDDLAGAFQDAVDSAGDDAQIPAGGTVAPTAPAEEASS